jgi:hypothetical protein
MVGRGWRVNGRQEVEIDGEQDVEQDMVDGQEVNHRQRRVRDKYAMGAIRLQTLPLPPELPAFSRASCRLQSIVLAASELSISSRASELSSRPFDLLQTL